jgi:Tol biopolymer transport system component
MALMASIAYGFLLIGVGVVAIILASSVFIMLPPSLLPNQQSAYGGTFPGENGKIAFEGGLEIYVINANGSEQTRLTYGADPSWSPDGTKIAFYRSGENNEIYVMNAADGSEQTRLTNNAGFTVDWDPSWSPDGTKIAFTSDRDLNWEIYVMNADGSEQTNISNNLAAHESDPSWSPDGTKIAFTSNRNNNYDIYVMNAADGSEQTRLTNNPDLDRFPSWSPDGTKIAFSSYIDGNEEIYVMNAADGSEQTRLTNNPHPDYFPSWSPDGTKIAFISGRERDPEDVTHRAVYVMNANDGSDVTRLTAIDKIYHAPDWGPAPEPPEEDTAPPVLTVPDNKVAEATSEQGTQVTYTVTAQDNVDGNATLEEDGTTVTQDDVGGEITISCNPPPGSTFPIGDTEVECGATDAAGNVGGPASFTVTVNPPPTPAQAIDELISTVENLDNVPQSVKTSLTAPLNGASDILNDDNPNNDKAVCGKLGAFINQVNANERRGTLTADQADELRTQAEGIRNKLDC